VTDPVAGAFAAIDAANALDPTSVSFGGITGPLAKVQGERATVWLGRLEPDPSLALQFAVRAHHLRRWTVERASYPEGRAGYHRWKRAAKEAHAAALGEVLAPLNLDDAVVARAQTLVQRIGLGTDPETQGVEDCACLVFLEAQFESLVEKIGREKVVDAVRKTVKKMSPAAIALAGEAVESEIGRSVLVEATT
jgi:hypothetical protein